MKIIKLPYNTPTPVLIYSFTDFHIHILLDKTHLNYIARRKNIRFDFIIFIFNISTSKTNFKLDKIC